MTSASDLVISQLADDCARLEEQVARYRQLAAAGIEKAHELTAELDKARKQVADQREQLRTLFTAERELDAAKKRQAAA